MNKIKTNRLFLAGVRYFDIEHNGVEILPLEAYAFLTEVNGKYVNIFSPEEELPVYKRVPYSNTTRDGEDYGSMIMLVNGEVVEGPCFVLEAEQPYFRKEEMTMEELEQYIVSSDKFFVDRIKILQNKRKLLFGRKKLQKDLSDLEKLNDFFGSYEKGITYRKEKKV